MSLAAGGRVLPLYALLYGFSQVAVQKRLDAEATWETIKSVARSSSFIFFHVYNGSLVGCALRNGFGRFYYRVLVCIPGLISSYLALAIEKPPRRQALAFYVLNLASEVVYRMAVTKGYFKPVRHGEILLFALSLAAWYHLLKTHGFGHDPVSGVVKYLIGRDEAKSRGRQKKSIESDGQDTSEITTKTISKHSELPSGLRLPGGRHACCPHSESACLLYVLRPIPTRFLAGCLIQAVLKLSSKPREFIRNPSGTLSATIVSDGTLKFGMFLATLVSSGRLTSCALRRISNSNKPKLHAAVSGFVAGLSMFWAPRSSLSMYIMWKAIEQYYLMAAREGKIPYFNFSIMTIYSFSAAALLYTFALEPGLMRPSYMKFLDNLSDHRLHQLNRMVLDVFGTGSSIGYENYFPDLHPKLMSNQFKELIFNWMIQPYE